MNLAVKFLNKGKDSTPKSSSDNFLHILLYLQESAAQIITSYCDSFETETKLSADDREEAATTVIELIGNMLQRYVTMVTVNL